MKKRFFSLIMGAFSVMLILSGCGQETISQQLYRRAQKEQARIGLGMTYDQVTKKLGSPQEIKPRASLQVHEEDCLNGVVCSGSRDFWGLPDDYDKSTWLYKFSEMHVAEKIYPDTEYKYFLNLAQVTQKEYEENKDAWYIYVLDGKILDQEAGEKSKDPNLQTFMPNPRSTGRVLVDKPRKPHIGYRRAVYTPAIAVMFDNDTGVVVDRVAYFIEVDEDTEMIKQ